MKITMIYRFMIRVDIAKDTLALNLLDRKTGQSYPHQVPNTSEGFEALNRWLANHEAGKSETVLCSEHTGDYGDHLLGWTTEAGWPHAVLKTTTLKKVGNKHLRTSDPWDARGLAEYGHCFADRLRLNQAPKPAVKQLGRLRAERRVMVDRSAALKQKRTEAGCHDADMGALLDMWYQQIALLTAHIEQCITTLIEQDSKLSSRHRTMRSAPGMGPVFGRLWLALFAGQESLNPAKICSRFGGAPPPHSSGSSVSAPIAAADLVKVRCGGSPTRSPGVWPPTARITKSITRGKWRKASPSD